MYELDELINDARVAAGAGGGGLAAIERIRPMLERFVGQEGVLPEKVLQPRPDRYAQYPLYVDPEGTLSIVSFVWGAGQRTPVHDHCVWGLVGVYQAEEQEVRYRRADRPAEGGQVWLTRAGETVCGKGSVSAVIPPDDIHEVSNCGNQVAVSVHLYGTDIGKQQRHVYDLETGAVREFVSGYDTPPGDRAC